MDIGGLSKARLGRMHDVMAGYVERGEAPGIVTLVSRRGEVHVDAIGTKAVGGDQIRRDTIFRISSMTKPIAAAAAMILVEECKLRLDEPGVLIGRAPGKPLETFLGERLFEPLGMKDTSFSVPASKLNRLATSYLTNRETGAVEPYDTAEGGQWSRPPAFPSAAGGLVS